MKVNSRVRVLHLGSPTGLYGAERWILALINNVDRSKIDSAVAVIIDDPDLKADLCQQAELLHVPATKIVAYGKINLSAVTQLKTYIQENEIDILHTHGYKTDIIGLLATLGTKCRIITTPHGWSVNAGIKLKIYETLDRIALCFFDRVVPLSEELYAGLKLNPFVRNKLQLISNGVDLIDIDREEHINSEINQWKSDGYFVIGYIGQLIPRKGLDLLLIALTKLQANWKLAIIGDGESQQELLQLARSLHLEDRIKFFGFRSDRLSYLRGFDLFVLPSHLEGVPRCLMEAMACRVPVVASDIPGCRDLIKNGINGLLFAQGDVHALQDVLTIVMNDAMHRKQLGHMGRKSIEDDWSASRMAVKYEQLYSDITDD
jgi:glycosyltransferase involved in cell wall biosynthesis